MLISIFSIIQSIPLTTTIVCKRLAIEDRFYTASTYYCYFGKEHIVADDHTRHLDANCLN